MPLVEDQDQPSQSHHRGRGDHQHQIGPAGRGAGQHVALLDVERADLVVALQVGIDVGHHQPVAAEQAVDAGLHGAGTQHRPVAVAAQAEQQVVAAITRVEDVGPNLIDRGQIEPVGLDQLLEAGHDVAGVMEHALVGVQGEVGQHDQTVMARGRAQTLGQGHGQGRGARAARARDGHQAPSPSGRGRRGANGRVTGGALDGRRASQQHRQEVGPVEGVGQNRVDAHPGPVGPTLTVVDHDDRGADLLGPVDQVAIDRREAAVDDDGRERLARDQSGRQLLGGHALHELDRERRVGRPPAQVAEPGRSGSGQTQESIARRAQLASGREWSPGRVTPK